LQASRPLSTLPVHRGSWYKQDMITDPPAHAPLPTRRQQIVATVLIAVACGLVYWTSLEAPFVFDDIHYIKHNVLLRDLSAPGQVVSFNPARALLLLSFAINWAISGLQTSGYHLTNVLIHMVNAFLVFRLLAELIGRAASRGPPLGRYHELAPLFGALLFAVHPLQTEAVTYIVGRSSSLATLFYLLALASFLHVHRRGRRIGWWAALLVLLYLLGLATKEIVATLPAALLLVELLLLERPGRRERLLKLHLPLWIVFWILVILRLTLLG